MTPPTIPVVNCLVFAAGAGTFYDPFAHLRQANNIKTQEEGESRKRERGRQEGSSRLKQAVSKVCGKSSGVREREGERQ
jgi:hypothetical protein